MFSSLSSTIWRSAFQTPITHDRIRDCAAVADQHSQPTASLRSFLRHLKSQRQIILQRQTLLAAVQRSIQGAAASFSSACTPSQPWTTAGSSMAEPTSLGLSKTVTLGDWLTAATNSSAMDQMPTTSNISMPPRQPQQQQRPTAPQQAQTPQAPSAQDSMQQQQQQQEQQPVFWQGVWSFGACADQHIPAYMEDRHTAVDLSDHPAFAGCHRAGLFAVFDGHGGYQVAEYLQTHFQQRVLSAGCAALAADPQQALTAAVQQLEQEVLLQFPPECHPGDTVPRAPGSTLCAVLLIDDKLHTVNVGDSRAALVSGTSSVQLTQDHSPACPAERRRISDTDPDAISKYDDYIYGSVKLSRGIGVCAPEARQQ